MLKVYHFGKPGDKIETLTFVGNLPPWSICQKVVHCVLFQPMMQLVHWWLMVTIVFFGSCIPVNVWPEMHLQSS